MLDFVTAFNIAGLLVRAAIGNSIVLPATVGSGTSVSINATGLGFEHQGTAALIVIGMTVAYFVIGRYFAGGTIWQRVFGTQAT